MITGDFVLLCVLLPMAVFVVVVPLVAMTAANRGVPDPGRTRLTATYLCVVLFLSLFTALFAASAAVGSLLSMAGGDDVEEQEFRLSPSFDEEGNPDFGEQIFEPGPMSDEDKTGEAVGSLVLALVAGAVLVYHRGKLIELQEEGDFADGPAAPVFLTYLYASLLVAFIALVVGASQALDGFAHVLAPDSLSSGEADLVREEGARRLFTGGFLAAASLAVVVLHQRERAQLDAPPEPEPPDQPPSDDPIA